MLAKLNTFSLLGIEAVPGRTQHQPICGLERRWRTVGAFDEPTARAGRIDNKADALRCALIGVDDGVARAVIQSSRGTFDHARGSTSDLLPKEVLQLARVELCIRPLQFAASKRRHHRCLAPMVLG